MRNIKILMIILCEIIDPKSVGNTLLQHDTIF
jgi:hypothetical protein